MRVRRQKPDTGPQDYARWLDDIDIGMPDWRLRVDDGGLHIVRPIDPSRARDIALGPGDVVHFNAHVRIADGLSFDEFVDCVHFAVLWAGEHETNEHFRVRGELRFNPHAAGAFTMLMPPDGTYI